MRRSSTAVHDLAHVGEAHRGAVAPGDDQRAVVGGAHRLVVGVDLPAARPLLDRALRAVGVGRGEGGAHVLEPDAVVEQRVRIELHAHRRQRAAAEDHLADAGDLRQALQDHVGGGVVELPAGQRLRHQRHHQDRRVGGVDLAIGGVAAQAGGQVGAGGVDRRLHVARGAVDAAVEAELQHDAGLPDRALRRHLGDVGDLAEMPLQRRGDRGRDGFRTGAGQRGADHDGREIDLRQRRHRQARIGEQAGERQADGQQRGGDRARDERGGDVHGGVDVIRRPQSPAAPSPASGAGPRRRWARRSKAR